MSWSSPPTLPHAPHPARHTAPAMRSNAKPTERQPVTASPPGTQAAVCRTGGRGSSSWPAPLRGTTWACAPKAWPLACRLHRQRRHENSSELELRAAPGNCRRPGGRGSKPGKRQRSSSRARSARPRRNQGPNIASASPSSCGAGAAHMPTCRHRSWPPRPHAAAAGSRAVWPTIAGAGPMHAVLSPHVHAPDSAAARNAAPAWRSRTPLPQRCSTDGPRPPAKAGGLSRRAANVSAQGQEVAEQVALYRSTRPAPGKPICRVQRARER